MLKNGRMPRIQKGDRRRGVIAGGALGTDSWVPALTSPQGQFLQSLSASISPSEAGGIILPRSQSSLTPSLSSIYEELPCESNAGSDPRNRKVRRE